MCSYTRIPFIRFCLAAVIYSGEFVAARGWLRSHDVFPDNILAIVCAVLTNTSWQEETANDAVEPYFDVGNTTAAVNNVTVIGVVGRSVQLKCKVQSLGNKTVNMTRKV